MKINNTNIQDSVDEKILKERLKEFSELIVSSPIFSDNNNAGELSSVLYNFMKDLYIDEPIEVINFMNQKPSKKLVENIFLQFGISPKISRTFPDLVKSKIAYQLAQLFEAKGSIKVFDIFNEILEEFYKNLNFYNIQVHQRKIHSKYEDVSTRFIYYTDLTGNPDGDATSVTKDNSIEHKIFHSVHIKKNMIRYKIKFFEPLKQDIEITLSYTDTYKVLRGATEFIIEEFKYDIYEFDERDENELYYKLSPVLIRDKTVQLDEINIHDIRTSKYIMNENDYFSEDYRNENLKNVFPINTNILHIQFDTSDTMDTMEYLPNLIRIYAMTKLQNKLFTFSINDLTFKVPMYELLNILSYIRLKEVHVNNPLHSYNKEESVPYHNLIYNIDKLDEIYQLITFYKDMKHDYNQIKEFKSRYHSLINDDNQLSNSNINNIDEFANYLSGNIPDTFEELWLRLDEFYPDGQNILSGNDQHLIMKREVYKLYDIYKPKTTRELFSIIAMQDTEYKGLLINIHDMLKLKFIDKYPRMVQAIENITESTDFVELYLLNYKYTLVEVVKMDNMITYFVNDIYKRFLLGAAFKEKFFDPIINLFQHYFFPADLSYQNSDTRVIKINNKLQSIPLGDVRELFTIKESTSLLFFYDNNSIIAQSKNNDHITYEDNFHIEITNNDEVIYSKSDKNDSEHNN